MKIFLVGHRASRCHASETTVLKASILVSKRIFLAIHRAVLKNDLVIRHSSPPSLLYSVLPLFRPSSGKNCASIRFSTAGACVPCELWI